MISLFVSDNENLSAVKHRKGSIYVLGIKTNCWMLSSLAELFYFEIILLKTALIVNVIFTIIENRESISNALS